MPQVDVKFREMCVDNITSMSSNKPALTMYVRLDTSSSATPGMTLRWPDKRWRSMTRLVAMAATFGSVSADSPLTSSSYMVHGPNAMDVEYLNKLNNNLRKKLMLCVLFVHIVALVVI